MVPRLAESASSESLLGNANYWAALQTHKSETQARVGLSYLWINKPFKRFWPMLTLENHWCWQQWVKQNPKGGNKLPLSVSTRVEEVRDPEPPSRCVRSPPTRDECHNQLGRRTTEKRCSSQSEKMGTMPEPDLSQSETEKRGKFLLSLPPLLPGSAVCLLCLPGKTSYQRPTTTSRFSSATRMNALPSHWKLPGLPSNSLRTLLSQLSASSMHMNSMNVLPHLQQLHIFYC